MERKYNVYELNGFKLKEVMSSYDTTKGLAGPYRDSFTVKEMTETEIKKSIEEGTVFFPFSVKVKTRDVLPYEESGFKIMFLKAGEHKELYKELLEG